MPELEQEHGMLIKQKVCVLSGLSMAFLAGLIIRRIQAQPFF
jgi:hypothetical protein